MSKKVKLLLALIVAVLVYKMVAGGGSTVEVDYDLDEE
jgi:hypothetical protein